ncbi:MAG TPA: heme o synthase [Bryobacteraceae bacterium]|jgi:protoheme IX farnesyltransferase|nr:heme o synthase [Bryobacteraceae bacterium]
MGVLSARAIGITRDTQPSFWAAVRETVPDLWELTKPEVNLLILVAASTGFYLGYPHGLNPFPFERLFQVLAGTLLVASGAGALNQYLEFGFDAQMRRTSRRPIAAGRLSPVSALWFGISMAVIGAADLLLFANVLAASLAVITIGSYLFIYTPLKRKTPLCTVAGAFAGAMPPLIGWAAANGSIASAQAWCLYAILFFWQFPHFMAIAWMYREDYARAGYFVLPSRRKNAFLVWLTVVPSIMLLLVSFAAIKQADDRTLPLSVTVILGLGLLFYVGRQVALRSKAAARQLLKATIAYLLLEMLILTIVK